MPHPHTALPGVDGLASVGGFRDVASSLPQDDEVSPAAAVFLSDVKCYSVNTVSPLGHARETLAMAPRPGRIRGWLTPLRAASRWHLPSQPETPGDYPIWPALR